MHNFRRQIAVIILSFLLTVNCGCLPYVRESAEQVLPGSSGSSGLVDIASAEEGLSYTAEGEITGIVRYGNGNALVYFDINSEEIPVYIRENTGIDMLSLSIGEFYSVTGILSEYNGMRELVPSSDADLERIGGYHFEKVRVVSVTDGDTIRIENSSGQVSRVRIIGVDSPETEKEGQPGEFYADEASGFTEDTLLGRTVYLEKDNSDTDRYGRLLRYVWLSLPEEINADRLAEYNFSAMLLKGGYAESIEVGEDNKYASVFESLEQSAAEKDMGMWSAGS